MKETLLLCNDVVFCAMCKAMTSDIASMATWPSQDRTKHDARLSIYTIERDINPKMMLFRKDIRKDF